MFRLRVTVKGSKEPPGEAEWSSLGEADPFPDPARSDWPGEFQRADEFRQKMERKSGQIPRFPLPPPVIYGVLVAALAWWCYYGYQYNQTHFPVSLPAIVVFFGVFLALFLVTMFFRELHRRARMFPVLQRLATLRPGAFLVVEERSPVLFYARETWIGRVGCEEGGEHQDEYTRLEARLHRPAGRLEIRRRRLLEQIFSASDRTAVALPESDFSREFALFSPEGEAARGFLSGTVIEAVLRLHKLGDTVVHIDRGLVRVEVKKDLGKPRREEALGRFLADAELLVGVAAGESVASGPSAGEYQATRRPGILKKIPAFTAAALLLVLAGLSFGEWRFHNEFVQRGRELRGLAGVQEPVPITGRDLEALPLPVRRYLGFAGVVGKTRISFVHYRGRGTAPASAGRAERTFAAEYFFTTREPSVALYVKNRLSWGMHAAAYESYFAGKGQATGKLMSIFFKRVEADEASSRALFQRFLTGMSLYPTAFLDRERIAWGESDGQSAEAVFRDGVFEASARFFFGPDHSIARVELMRAKRGSKDAPPEKWTATYGDYREFKGFKLPTTCSTAWNRKTGDVPLGLLKAKTIDLE